MPILVIVSLALQIACAVHVVRSGRPLYWIWILFIGSYLAVIVYFIVAIVPDLRNDPRSRVAANRVRDTIDPERRRRTIQQRLEVADTVDNRRALAEESMRLGDYANAAELYRSILKGMYATDAGFLIGPDRPFLLYLAWLVRLVPGAALHPHHSLVTAGTVARARRRGYPVNVWTVDEPEEMIRLAALGVDGILTDRPDLLRRAFRAARRVRSGVRKA